ncbi:MAG: stage IV sporulation protein A [Erysipelotrichaceae bacterium]|nr:stage IV sporulation protein A [Erysipelotrichaceae bacterium]
METLSILKDIGLRNNGDIYLGVVGPVRVGKSTFIKRFMEVMVIPHITNEDDKKRALDELPQSGLGKTIMTMEPKFVPANAVEINVEENLSVKVRLIDCVGYIIENSQGYLEDGKMRLVKTPWFSETIPFDEAAKIGTQKVIKEHSTLGICIVSDGTITEFKREEYLSAEEQVIEELNSIEKPYVIVLNTKTPSAETTFNLKNELEKKYNVPVIAVNVESMTENDATEILRQALYQYPISNIDVALPNWVSVLDENHYLKQSIKNSIEEAMGNARTIRDVNTINDVIKNNEYIANSSLSNVDTGTGVVTVQMEVKDGLYETILKELVGCEISDKAQLIAVLTEFVKAKREYQLIGSALQMAETTGYGFSNASLETMKIEKPTATKSGNRYGVKIKAVASTYHIIKVDLETSFEPTLGSKMQSDYFLDYLLKAYEEDPKKVLECELFGQKFGDIIKAGITGKLATLPEPIKIKLQQLIKTISNKGKSNLIAFVF